MFKLFVSKRSSSTLKKLPPERQKAIVAALEEIEENPYSGKPLERELLGQFSWRVWIYRIVYKVYEKDQKIVVLRIGHRSKVYD